MVNIEKAPLRSTILPPSLNARSPSKTFNLAGLQTSNIFIPNRTLRKTFKKAIDQAGYSQLNTLGLVACQAAYEEGGEWLEQLKAYLQEAFDRLAEAALLEYPWPGNIRELKNTVRRAVVFAGEGRISAQELNLDQGMKLGNMIVCPEKEEQQILRILGQTGNNRTLTARVLGISRTALYYKLRKYGIV